MGGGGGSAGGLGFREEDRRRKSFFFNEEEEGLPYRFRGGDCLNPGGRILRLGPSFPPLFPNLSPTLSFSSCSSVVFAIGASA